jgi:hypothetical protein
MASLLIGPMLRYVDDEAATIWLEADGPCVVEILGHCSETFQINGRHYAILAIGGLQPDSCVEYEVLLDGERLWPEADGGWPPSRIRTLPRSGPLDMVFGSCRVTRPHAAPRPARRPLAAHAPAARRSGLCGRGLTRDGRVHPCPP